MTHASQHSPLSGRAADLPVLLLAPGTIFGVQCSFTVFSYGLVRLNAKKSHRASSCVRHSTKEKVYS